jgi:hypothetical protein
MRSLETSVQSTKRRRGVNPRIRRHQAVDAGAAPGEVAAIGGERERARFVRQFRPGVKTDRRDKLSPVPSGKLRRGRQPTRGLSPYPRSA